MSDEVPVAKAEQVIEERNGRLVRGNFMNLAEPFEEGGYTFECWEPANGEAPRTFLLEAYQDGLRVGRREVPMEYPNQWGVDIADLNRLEAETEEFIQEVVAGRDESSE